MVMTALLLPALMAFMALSVDLSIITTSKAQLNTTADAAALSGAMKLADAVAANQSATDFSSSISSAQSLAKTIAQANHVLNTVPVINDNTSNSPTGDVVVGNWDPVSRTWTPPPLSSSLPPNAVQVTASRSATHGSLVPPFFSRTWGYQGTTVSVQSIAMAYSPSMTIQGFKPSGTTPANSPNANLLPIVLDVDTWKAMMVGTTTDQYTYNASINTVTSGADGITESLLYPVESGNPGNWGTIKVGVSNNSTSTLSAQIQYGITPTQLATYPNNTIALSSSTTPPSITFSGNPGISAGIKSALDAIIGKPVAIPIYDQTGGNGNNAWYRVIYFQPCRILAVNFQGNPKYVIIQPAMLNDATAIPQTGTTSVSSWSVKSSGLLIRPHLVQ
jgi:Flp pilus assembly protein TadG